MREERKDLKYLRRLNYLYAVIVICMTAVIIFALMSVASDQNDRLANLEERLLDEGRIGTLPEDRFDDLNRRLHIIIEQLEQN